MGSAVKVTRKLLAAREDHEVAVQVSLLSRGRKNFSAQLLPRVSFNYLN